MRVLVVEDEADLADAIARGLRREGYAVDVAYDGDEAVDKASVNDYDVVCLDLNLPRLDGIEVVRRIRADDVGQPTRVLMLTARDSTRDRITGLDEGADDYLVKPFDFEELKARVRALLRRDAGRSGAVLRVGDLELDSSRHDARRDGQPAAPDAQGVRAAALLHVPAGAGAQPGGAAGARLGRERRPLHQHRPGHRDDAAPQAGRGGRQPADRDRRRSRLPPARAAVNPPGWLVDRLPEWARSIRFRYTLLYSAVLFGLAAIVVAAIYLVLLMNLRRRAGLGRPRGVLHPLRRLHPAGLPERVRAPGQLPHPKELRNYSFGALGVLFVASLGVGWVVAGRVLRPIGRITAVARDIQATDLSRRIELPGPDDELKQLADTFDAMLARLDAAFAAQRQFTADASHELRNPLAIIRTNVDVALADPRADPDDLRQTLVVVKRASDRMARLVDDLLALARRQEPTLEHEQVDLGVAVAEASDDFVVPAAARSIVLDRAIAPRRGRHRRPRRPQARRGQPRSRTPSASPPPAPASAWPPAARATAPGSPSPTRAPASPPRTSPTSSTASGGPTRPAPAPTAAPASAWPSSARSPRATAATSASSPRSASAPPSSSGSRSPPPAPRPTPPPAPTRPTRPPRSPPRSTAPAPGPRSAPPPE